MYMKILHIINSLEYGGAESLLSDMACIQKRNGTDVSIIVLKDCVSGHKQKILSNGVAYIALSKNMSVYNPLYIFKLIRYIRKFDVVHVHLFPAQYWAGIAKMFSFRNIPMVTTEHSTMNRRRNNLIFRAIDNFFYRYIYNTTVCCSDKAFNAFCCKFPKAKAISIPNGIDIERVKDAKPVDLSSVIGVDRPFIVTMVARMAYPKRQDTLIESLTMLPSNVFVMLVGNGERGKLEELKGLAEDLGVKDRVYFLGIRDDVPSVLKASDVIVLSSEYEGLSLSSIEGMASGKPFIATNVDGLREVVKGAGLLFECGNAKELADNINRLKEDRSFYDKVAKECYMRAKVYDINRMVISYNRLYRYIVGDK